MKKGSEMSTTTTTEPEVQAPPEITTNPVSQLLWDAADLLERDGWCQREFEDAQGRYCLVGAINRALPLEVRQDLAEDLLEAAEMHMSKFVGADPMRWNDRPGRTKEEVISALRRASEEA